MNRKHGLSTKTASCPSLCLQKRNVCSGLYFLKPRIFAEHIEGPPLNTEFEIWADAQNLSAVSKSLRRRSISEGNLG